MKIVQDLTSRTRVAVDADEEHAEVAVERLRGVGHHVQDLLQALGLVSGGWGLGFGVERFGVQGLGFRVWGLRFRVES